MTHHDRSGGEDLVRQVQRLNSRLDELQKQVDAMADAAARHSAEGRTVYHVAPHDEGWQVELEGGERASSVHATKAEAVEAARELAHNREPSQVVIHRADGTIQRHVSYGDTTP